MITAESAKKIVKDNQFVNIDADLIKVYVEIESTSRNGIDVISWYNLSEAKVTHLKELGYDVQSDGIYDGSERFIISW